MPANSHQVTPLICAQCRLLSPGEDEMGHAAGGADRLHLEPLLERLEPIPEPLPPAEDDGHDDYVHVVDEVGSEELSDGGRASTDADVQRARRLLGNPEGRGRARVDEVERRAARHLDRWPGVVREDEYGRMKWRVVAPPAFPLFVSPWPTLGPNLPRPMISTPIPEFQPLAKTSSTPLLPPRSPCVSWKPRKLRVGKNHSWSRLPACPKGASKL